MRTTSVLFVLFFAVVGCNADDSPTGDTPLTHDEVAALNNVACAYMEQYEIGKAEKIFREITERAPEASEAWVNLGIALLNLQPSSADAQTAAYEECETVMRRMMKERPDLAHPPFVLGVLLHYLGKKPEEYTPFFEKAWQLDPEDADTNYRMGAAFFTARKMDEAVARLERTVAIEPHHMSGWYKLQQACRMTQQPDKANEALKAYKKFDDAKPVLGRKVETKYGWMGRYACVMREVTPFGDERKAEKPARAEIRLAEQDVTNESDHENKSETKTKSIDAGKSGPPSSSSSSSLRFGRTSKGGGAFGSATNGDDAWPNGMKLAKGGSIRAFLLDDVVPRLHPGIALHDIDGDGTPEAYVADGRGIGRIYRLGNGAPENVTAKTGIASVTGDLRSLGGIFADVDHDGHPDLYVYGAGRNVLFRNDGKGRFSRLDGVDGGDAITTSAQLVDADHDGDLDILVGGYLTLPAADVAAERDMTYPVDFAGAPNHLYNNKRPTIFDKKKPSGPPAFEDIGERTGVRGTNERTACVLAVDVERDGDIDIFLADDRSKNRLLMNDRLWTYHDEAKFRKIDDAGPATWALATDIDRNGLPDIVLMRGPDAPNVLLRNRLYDFEVKTNWADGLDASFRTGLVAAGDLDNDGDADFVAVDGMGGAPFAAANDSGRFTPIATPIVAKSGVVRGMIMADMNADGLLDVVCSKTDGTVTTLINGTETKNNWIGIALRGKEGFSPSESWANTFGLGATVEVAAGNERSYADIASTAAWRSGATPTLHIGLGTAKKADYVRIIWPDLVLQTEHNLAANQTHVIQQVNRKPSSCPIVFKPSATGDGFDFVADFLGVGGLGFFMKPGTYAPPDSTEMVRLGDVRARDGKWELRVSEPMEEICYLDEMKLVVVEHDVDVEVYADERLATGGDDPTGRPIPFRHVVRPTRATTKTGVDTTDEVRRSDRKYHRGVDRDRRFVGYLEDEQQLTLAFDRDAIETTRPTTTSPSGSNRTDATHAPRLHLFIDGWVEYPYSHVNFAAWQAGVKGQGFSVDVVRHTAENKDGSGHGNRIIDGKARDNQDGTGHGNNMPATDWQTLLSDVGYPAGMLRTMAIDVTDAVTPTFDGRLRLRTNLEVYVDSCYLAWEDAGSGLTVHELVFDEAELRYLGYPEEHSPDGTMPLPYDYQRILATMEDWKSIGGHFTRYGDVRELLTAADDRYVVMNHGEEIALSVKTSRLPTLPKNRRRTFFLKADGWCKDMDAYTAFPGTVKPLPHHGMSGYPPKTNEAYPTSETLDAYRKAWNTRVIEGGPLTQRR